MFTLQILIGLVLGPKSPLAFAMYADTADYTEWRTGRRATAMTFAAATFSQKLGTALASVTMGSVFGPGVCGQRRANPQIADGHRVADLGDSRDLRVFGGGGDDVLQAGQPNAVANPGCPTAAAGQGSLRPPPRPTNA